MIVATFSSCFLLLLLVLVLPLLLVVLLELVLQASTTYPSPHRNTMLLKDGTTSKNMLPRGLTSFLDSVQNKTIAWACCCCWRFLQKMHFWLSLALLVALKPSTLQLRDSFRGFGARGKRKSCLQDHLCLPFACSFPCSWNPYKRENCLTLLLKP